MVKNSLLKKHGLSGPPEIFLFLVLVVLNLIFYLYLILNHRLVQGHDGFADCTLEYFFLNSAVQYNEIPQWIPFITHGTTALWWYVILGVCGIFTNALFLLGPLLKGLNFLPIFYWEIFLDELVLLTGTWLLARRFYNSSYTIFFVASCVLFSCVSLVQIKYPLRLIYAIPLIIYFLHTFLDKKQWRYFFLAAYLYLFQCIGNLIYFIPVSSLIIFSYFLFYALTNFAHVKEAIKKLRFNGGFWITLLFILFFAFAFYKIFKFAGSEIAIHTQERNPDGSASLNTFLTYGGNTDLRKFKECFLRVSPRLDFTIYFGLLSLILVTLSFIFSIRRKNCHIYLMILFFLLVSMGTFVSTGLYYCWPLMKFYRHLASLAVIVKYFLCFAAGFGFESIFLKRLSPVNRKTFLVVCILVAVGLIFASYSMNSFPPNYHFRFRLRESALNAVLFSALFACLPFLNFMRYQKAIMTIILLLHIFDVYTYKFAEGILRTFPLNERQYQLLAFSDFPYPSRRNLNLEDGNPRNVMLETPVRDRALYCTIDAFLFNDPLTSPHRTDYWQRSYDQYLRAYYHQSIDDFSVPFEGYKDWHIEFPKHPAALKISGATEDKIQFFSKVYMVSKDDRIASLMADRNYSGDMLFLSNDTDRHNKYNFLSFPPNIPLKNNNRLNLNYRIVRYTPNSIDIAVDVPQKENVWLLYSDAWHSFWKAKINGEEVPVFRANLAYKAIPLKKGQNEVRFFFDSLTVRFLYSLFGISAIFWIVIIFYLDIKICTKLGHND